MLQEQSNSEDGVLALHPQCLASAPTFKSAAERCSHDTLNNVLFFIEGAYLKLTGDDQLFDTDPKMTEHGFEYFVTRTTTEPCEACLRHMATGLIARLLEKAAEIPARFGAERVSALTHMVGVYRSNPKSTGTVLRKRRMCRYFRNHRAKRAELMDYLEEGEQKRQGLLIIYADEVNDTDTGNA